MNFGDGTKQNYKVSTKEHRLRSNALFWQCFDHISLCFKRNSAAAEANGCFRLFTLLRRAPGPEPSTQTVSKIVLTIVKQSGFGPSAILVLLPTQRSSLRQLPKFRTLCPTKLCDAAAIREV